METGSLTVSFITLLPWALAWLLSLLHLYEVPGFCVNNKGQAAVITREAAAALPGTALTSLQDTGGLCLCPLREGYSLSSSALRPERAAYLVSKLHGETRARLFPQGWREAGGTNATNPTDRSWAGYQPILW